MTGFFLELTKWLVYLGAVGATTFPLAYALRYPTRGKWFRSAIGRALMTKAVGVMLLFDLSAVQILYPFALPAWASCLIVALVVAGINYQCAVLLRTQAEVRRGHDPHNDLITTEDPSQ